MLMEQTLQKLQDMKLQGMLKSYEERRITPEHQGLSFDDFFSLLVEDEYISRQNTKQSRLLRDAHLKITAACVENIDYRQARGLQKTSFMNLQNTDWLDRHYNILITGPTGVGKSYLACALGNWACRKGYTVRYYRWPRLLETILLTRGDGTYLRFLRKLAKIDLLIIDDFGLNALTDPDRKDLLEMIEDRYLCRSSILCSQLPLSDWHAYIGEPTLADAICDRLFHVAHKFELKGGSMRQNSVSQD